MANWEEKLKKIGDEKTINKIIDDYLRNYYIRDLFREYANEFIDNLAKKEGKYGKAYLKLYRYHIFHFYMARQEINLDRISINIFDVIAGIKLYIIKKMGGYKKFVADWEARKKNNEFKGK